MHFIAKTNILKITRSISKIQRVPIKEYEEQQIFARTNKILVCGKSSEGSKKLLGSRGSILSPLRGLVLRLGDVSMGACNPGGPEDTELGSPRATVLGMSSLSFSSFLASFSALRICMRTERGLLLPGTSRLLLRLCA